MNKLQIIEEIFGEKFCAHAKCLVSGIAYSAVLRDNNSCNWVTPNKLKEIFEAANKYNLRIGVDFYRFQFDIYFPI